MSTTRGRPASLNAFLNARSAVIGLCRVAFLGLQHAAAAPLTTLGHGGGIDEPEAEGPGLYVLYALSAILVVAGGAFAGLTIAYVFFSSLHIPFPLPLELFFLFLVFAISWEGGRFLAYDCFPSSS